MSVFVDRELDAFGALRVAALAGEIRVGVEFGSDLADLVVEDLEALFVLGDPPRSVAHRSSLRRGSSWAASAASAPRFWMTWNSSQRVITSASSMVWSVATM